MSLIMPSVNPRPSSHTQFRSKPQPKILFINSPAPFSSFPNAGPNMGVGYMMSYLEMYGYESDYLNLEDVRPSQVIIPSGYDFYCISSMYPNLHYAIKIHREIKRRNLGITVIGGPASLEAQQCLLEGVDFVVKGFGEVAILAIIRGEVLPGIIQGVPTPDINIPFAPAWKKLWRRHDVSFGRITGHIITMRGCPYKCNFCSSAAIYGPIATFRRVENIVAEVESLISSYDITDLYLYDTCFTFNRKRAIAISRALGRLGISWACQTRVDLVDPELLRIMRRSGCIQISFGIETGSNVLESLGKQTTLELNATAIRMCHDAGIRIKAFLMTGLPGETQATLDQNLDFFSRSRVDDWHLSVFQALPETAFWRYPAKYGLTIVTSDSRLSYPLGLNSTGPVNHYTKWLSRFQIRQMADDYLAGMMELIPNPRIQRARELYPVQAKGFQECLMDLVA